MLRAILLRILLLVIVYSIIFYHLAHAKDFGELKGLYVDYKNFSYLNPNQRNPVIYPTPPSTGLDFGEEMDLFWGYGYVNANVESLTDAGQFREVGLEYRIGARPWKNLEIGLWHLSQHNLDRAPPAGYYSFQTAIEIKVWLFKR